MTDTPPHTNEPFDENKGEEMAEVQVQREEQQSETREPELTSPPVVNATPTPEGGQSPSRQRPRRSSFLTACKVAVVNSAEEPLPLSPNPEGFDGSPQLVDVVEALHSLSPQERFVAASTLQTIAFYGVYASGAYVPGQWYLPKITKTDEEGCAVGYDLHDGGLWMRCCGRRVSLQVGSLFIRCLMLIFLWTIGATLISSSLFARGGYVFDPVVTVLVAVIVGGGISRMLGIPPLVGVLWVGIFWNNIPSVGHLTGGIVPETRKSISAIALVLILSRAGLALSLPTFKQSIKNAAALATIPFALEALLHSILAHHLFHHTNMGWSALQGIMSAAVAPAVVVPTVLSLQEKGFGKAIGPLPLMLSAVTIDMVVGIWGANFMTDLLLEDDVNLGLLIALGPIQIIAGVIIGILEGHAMYWAAKNIFAHEAKHLPVLDEEQEDASDGSPGSIKRHHHPAATSLSSAWMVVMLMGVGLATYGAATKLKIAGGGAIAVITAAAILADRLSLSKQSDMPPRRPKLAADCAFLWDCFLMPCLFSMVGSTVALKELFDGSFFLKALACLVLGVAGRAMMSPLCSAGLSFAPKDLIVLVVGWIGKASVQGALGAVPYLRVVSEYGEGGGADHKEDFKSAVIVRDQAVLAILIMAPVSSILLTVLGPRLLNKEV